MRDYYLTGLIILSIFTFFLYSLNFSSEFLEGLDDDLLIYENELVQALTIENQKLIWTNQSASPYYAPIMYLSHAIDIALFGNNAYLMKVENLLIFIGSAWLLYWLFMLLGVPKSLIFITLVLYLLHPLQVENIAWTASRRQVLSIFFLLATCIAFFYFFTRTKKKWVYFTLSLFFFFLSVGSKPPGLVFLPLCFTGIFIYHFHTKSTVFKFINDVVFILPFLFIGGFYMFMNSLAADRNFLEQEMGYDLLQHLLIITGSFGFYLEKIFSGPYTFFYPIAPPEQFEYLKFTFYTVLTTVLFVIGLVAFIKKHFLISGAVLWYFITLIPSSLVLLVISDLPVNTTDRYFTIASPGIFFVLSVFVHQIFRQYQIYFAILLILPLAYFTHKQIGNWENSITAMQHNINHYPSEEMYHRLAMVYYEHDEKEKAFELLDQAAELDKGIILYNHFYVDFKLAVMYAEKGDKESSRQQLIFSMQKDLEPLTDKNDADFIIEKTINRMLPFSEDLGISYRRYFELRDSLIQTGQFELKPTRE